MKDFFSRGNLLIKLMLSYFVLLLIPIVILTNFYFQNITSLIHEKLNEIQMREVQNISAVTEETVRSVGIVQSNLLFHGAVNSLFSDGLASPVTSSQASINVRELVESLASYKVAYPSIHSIYIYDAANNSIIDSVRSLCRASDFYDHSFLRNLDTARAAIYPARDFFPEKAVDVSTPIRARVVTFTFPLINQAPVKGIVIINVFESAFNPAVHTTDNPNKQTTILNRNGNVISGAKVAEVESISVQPGSSGVLTLSGNRIAAYHFPDNSQLVYVTYYPSDTVSQEIGQLNAIILVMIAVCLLVGTLVILWLVNNLYSPIKNASRRLSLLAESALEQHGSDNELKLLNHAITSVLRQKQQLEKDLLNARIPLEQMALLSFVSGKTDIDSLPQLNIDPSADVYCVAMLKLTGVPSTNLPDSNEDQYYYRTLLLELVNQTVQERSDIFVKGAQLVDHFIILLFYGAEADNAGMETRIYEILKEAQREISQIDQFSFIGSIGSVTNDLHSARVSYQEAVHAINYSLCFGETAIISYDELSFAGSEMMPRFSEEKLSNLLEVGDLAKIELLIQEYSGQLIDYRFLENDSIYAAFYDIVNMLQRFARTHGVHFVNIGNDTTSQYAALSKCDSIQGMTRLVCTYAAKVVESYLDLTQTRLITARDLEAFIENNCKDSEMSIVMMVEKLGISYSYARKLFKEYFDSTFVNYLNMKRIQKAKVLMNQGGLSIKNVAVSVGYNNDQSFTRFFKKLEGITPGEYKKMLHAARPEDV